MICQDLEEEKSRLAQELIDSLLDDLNTTKFLGLLFKHKNVFLEDVKFASFVAGLSSKALGLDFYTDLSDSRLLGKKDPKSYDPAVKALILERDKARAEKDWQKADEIRDQLQEMGVVVRDDRL
jgi:cysteinyl-tRNA synthetase